MDSCFPKRALRCAACRRNDNRKRENSANYFKKSIDAAGAGNILVIVEVVQV